MFLRIAAIVALSGALLALDAGSVAAATLTGVVVYSADGRGMPTGFNARSATIDGGQLWHTLPSARWHGLGVLRGLPPESLSTPLLNGGDFGIQIPLEAGDHDFTLVGEPGPLTEDDGYDLWALNLFLDGVAGRPAISVLFPPGAYRYGVPVRPNRAEVTIALPVVPVSGVPQDVYDDGTTKVTVHAVSFLPPHRFVDVDLVSSTAPVPSSDGQSDWVGVLRIAVETTASEPATRGGSVGAPRAIGPEAFGLVPMDGVVVGGGSLDAEGEDALRDRPSGWRSAPVWTPTARTPDTEPPDADTPTPEAARSLSPAATPGTPTPGTPTVPVGSPTPPRGTPGPTGSTTVPPSVGATPSPPVEPGTPAPGSSPAPASDVNWLEIRSRVVS